MINAVRKCTVQIRIPRLDASTRVEAVINTKLTRRQRLVGAVVRLLRPKAREDPLEGQSAKHAVDCFDRRFDLFWLLYAISECKGPKLYEEERGREWERSTYLYASDGHNQRSRILLLERWIMVVPKANVGSYVHLDKT